MFRRLDLSHLIEPDQVPARMEHAYKWDELVDGGVRVITGSDYPVEELAPLENFILPGGTPGAAELHVARTVCRRAERIVIALGRQEPVGAWTVKYLNRLSDALFVMARHENKRRGAADVLWNSRT